MPKASDKEKYLIETFIEKARKIVPNTKLRFAIRMADGEPGLRVGVALPEGLRTGGEESFDLHQLAEQISTADQYLITATMTRVLSEGAMVDLDFLPKDQVALDDNLVSVTPGGAKSTSSPSSNRDVMRIMQTIGIWCIVLLAAWYVLRPPEFVRVNNIERPESAPEADSQPKSGNPSNSSDSKTDNLFAKPPDYELLSKRNQVNSSMIDLSSWASGQPETQALSVKKTLVIDDFSKLKLHLSDYATELQSSGNSEQQAKVLNLKKTIEMIQPVDK